MLDRTFERPWGSDDPTGHRQERSPGWAENENDPLHVQLQHAKQRIKYLEERLERKDKRITELLDEKTGLADQLQEKMREIIGLKKWREHLAAPIFESDQANEEEATQTSCEPRPVRHKGSAFTVHSWEDRHDSIISKKIDAVPRMDDWLPLRRPSSIKPVVLDSRAWVLSAVPEEERTKWMELIEEDTEDTEQDGGDGAANPVGEAYPEPPTPIDRSPDTTTHRPPKRPRRHSTPSPEPRSRSPRRHHQRGYHGSHTAHRRKAVCTHCWLTHSFCDRYPTCGTCVRDGVRCVRKLCEAGEECRSWRCPCLHPGEWDERDERIGGMVVERGRMPMK